jgi:adenylylsulfate kinase
MATPEHSGAVIWISGLPSSGKSTLAEAAQRHLDARGVRCCRLDGDAVRTALVPAPAHDGRARDEFYASLANLAGWSCSWLPPRTSGNTANGPAP